MARGNLRCRRRQRNLFPDRRIYTGLIRFRWPRAPPWACCSWPGIHRDPFDRIIIAQAITEGMLIVTSDGLIRRYPVGVVW